MKERAINYTAISDEHDRYLAAVRQVRSPADIHRLAHKLNLDESELSMYAALADVLALGGHHYALVAETYGVDADDLMVRVLEAGAEVEAED